mmetsp:Transcript_88542/g.271041  ORF Transcript_88542/g.271041 Transcript_88542/m.271041 type:complete len:382 (-) Transcript_88542:121-1266(-)
MRELRVLLAHCVDRLFEDLEIQRGHPATHPARCATAEQIEQTHWALALVGQESQNLLGPRSDGVGDARVVRVPPVDHAPDLHGGEAVQALLRPARPRGHVVRQRLRFAEGLAVRRRRRPRGELAADEVVPPLQSLADAGPAHGGGRGRRHLHDGQPPDVLRHGRERRVHRLRVRLKGPLEQRGLEVLEAPEARSRLRRDVREGRRCVRARAEFDAELRRQELRHGVGALQLVGDCDAELLVDRRPAVEGAGDHAVVDQPSLALGPIGDRRAEHKLGADVRRAPKEGLHKRLPPAAPSPHVARLGKCLPEPREAEPPRQALHKGVPRALRGSDPQPLHHPRLVKQRARLGRGPGHVLNHAQEAIGIVNEGRGEPAAPADTRD